MTRVTLSITEARDLDHADLIERIEAILSVYDVPELETQKQKLERLSRTIDETPAIYRWFLQLWSWCNHWAQGNTRLVGRNDEATERMRQRRDLFEKMASAAKLRYEAASRDLTLLLEFTPDGMPRMRRGPD